MILKLLFEVWDALPKSNVCVRSYSVESNSLLSRLRIVLRRVRLSLIKKGQWRNKWVVDSKSWPQLNKGFNVLKTMFEDHSYIKDLMCLENYVWIYLLLVAQTKSKSCNKFDSCKIANIKNRIWERSYEIKYFLP